ncbi:MAG: hypothetical protein HY200_09800 [Nitrospirae bacterium]|nr:hypothetical protein [Nitrospirota bacterium]MBI3595238.1 hypothetical protein [Nitrospirota bacterium]
MENQLHILKKEIDEKAQLIIQNLSERYPDKIRVVLIQEAIRVKPIWKCQTFCLIDVASSSVPQMGECEEIGYSRLVDLIFEADSVVTW